MLYHSISENGQGLMEYALILLFIAIAVIAVLLIFGPSIGNLYSQVQNLFPS
ncbi:MAG TPA: pilus assembly protein [Chloroflexi bacterium]|nr:pilus assembly protein [Chloroflexota bacterium]